MNSWKDEEVHARRLNKIIKYMETRLFKTSKDDPETIIHYATAINNLTRQTIEIIKLSCNLEEIQEFFKSLKKQQTQRNIIPPDTDTQHDELISKRKKPNGMRL